MKGKSFSTKEIVIVILLVLLLGYLAYNYFFDGMIEDKIKLETDQQADIQTKIDLVNLQLVEIAAQKAEIDLLGESGVKIRMPSYNGENSELVFIGSLVEGTIDTSYAAGDPTRNGDQIRRPFTISFKTYDYDKVVDVITKLNNSEVRCLIDDVKFIQGVNKTDWDSEEVIVYDVTVKATFYETMWDGVADQFLPADKSSTT